VTTAAKIFVGGAAFGAAIGGLYWWVAREPTGTVLLAFFGMAPLIAATYLWRGTRGRPVPPEDRPEADPGGSAGLEVGTFSTESAWPIIFAGASLVVGVGLVFGTWLLLPAGVLFAVAAVGLVRE
jgi:Cytochrome c oxidase subunit IV